MQPRFPPPRLAQAALHVSESEFLKFISGRMRARFDVRKIILFGSQAGGTASPDSGYDVLLSVDTDIPFLKRQGIAHGEKVHIRDFQ